MAVVVTGGAGFIGSHVVDLLQSQGKATIVVDDFSTGRRENVHSAATVHDASITDEKAMMKVAQSHSQVEAIIHCAAQASVVRSTTEPIEDMRTNVEGTLRMLELASAWNCPLVFTSTGGALYGDRATRPTGEESPPLPDSPYGASKASAEIYIRLHGRANQLPHAICRLGNVYGPRQRGDGEAGVVAIFTHRLMMGDPVVLYGHGNATRDYVHVVDVAKALTGAPGKAGTFNIATAIETSVKQVFDLVSTTVDVNVEPVLEPLRPGELSASCLAIEHAKGVLGWQPSVRVEDGIPATVAALVKAA